MKLCLSDVSRLVTGCFCSYFVDFTNHHGLSVFSNQRQSQTVLSGETSRDIGSMAPVAPRLEMGSSVWKL
jgi:predicted NAD/FAD-binding protein